MIRVEFWDRDNDDYLCSVTMSIPPQANDVVQIHANTYKVTGIRKWVIDTTADERHECIVYLTDA